MNYELLIGDCRETLRTIPEQSVHCCVTSPPYFGLRDYGHQGQIGLETTPEEFVDVLVSVFREVRRVLCDDGTVWLNLGDSWGHGTRSVRRASRTSTKVSAGQHKAQGGRHGGIAKQLLGIPWRVALALQDDGWCLRQDIIWNKPNSMPESVRDRCTKGHEYIFLLSKGPRYYYDHEAVKEPAANGVMRNRRSVWSVNSKPFKGAHFATFPPDLIEPCILAGCPEGGTVLDPFGGSGTTAGVALANKRQAILCELNPEYAGLVNDRVRAIAGEPVENQTDLFEEASA